MAYIVAAKLLAISPNVGDSPFRGLSFGSRARSVRVSVVQSWVWICGEIACLTELRSILFTPATVSGSDQWGVARPEGFEPPTLCSGGTRSIHLSYGRIPNRLELSHCITFCCG